jgi:hypothetical protein
VPTFQQFILAAGGASAIIIVLVGFTAVIFRDTLTAWLNRRLGRSLERESERFKHELAREITGFKDELDRAQSAERFKAEVRKAVAERMLAYRLEALNEVFAAVMDEPWAVIGQISVPPEERISLMQMRQRVIDFNSTIRRHSLYLSKDVAEKSRAVTHMLMELAEIGDRPALEPDGVERARAYALLRSLLEAIEASLKRLPDELADTIVASPVQTS